MKLSKIFAGIAMLAIPFGAAAQTVTVNQSATPNDTTFNTISAALAAVEADSAEPNIVQVTDEGTYEEVFSITTPVTLEATGDKATLALLPNANGIDENIPGNGGIWISLPSSLSTGTVILRNFNILPDLDSTTSATRLRTAIENGNNNLYLEVNNCIIAPNEEGHPLVTDPVTSRIYAVFPGSSGTPEPYNPDVVEYANGIVLGRADTGYFEGDGVELLLKDTVVSHFKHEYHPADIEPERTPTAVEMSSPYGTDPLAYDSSLTRITRIEGGGVSFARYLLSIAGDLDIRGTEESPVYLRGSASYSLVFTGPAFHYRNIDHTVIADMSSIGIYDKGYGPVRWTMKNSLMFMALNNVFLVDAVKDSNDVVVEPAAGNVLIEDSTLVGGRFHATAGRAAHTYRFGTGTETNVHFKNCIIGGKKDQIIDTNVISLAGSNDATMEGCALITEGPYALRPTNPFSRGTDSTVPVNEVEQRSGDPFFLETDAPIAPATTNPNYPASPGFLDVQNETYAIKNEAGGPLGGGADYVGGISKVRDWDLY